MRPVLCLTLVITCLAACVSNNALPSLTPEPTTILFGAPAADHSFFEPLIAAFQAENSTVRVEMVDVTPGQSLEELARSADVAMTNSLALGPQADALFLDLRPLMEADATFDMADYYPGSLTSRDGQVFLLPHTIVVPLLAYNPYLVANYGMPSLPTDVSWDELLAAAALTANHDEGGDVYGLFDSVGLLNALVADLRRSGVQLTPEGLATDQGALAMALEHVEHLDNTDVIVGSVGSTLSLSSDEAQQLIAQNRIAFWRADTLATDAPSESLGFTPGLVVYPSPVTTHVGQGYAISKGSLHAQAAWQWVRFLSTQPAPRRDDADPLRGRIPARRSLATRTGFWERMDAATSVALQAGLARVEHDTITIDPPVLTLLAEAITAVIRDQQDPQQVAVRVSTAAAQAQQARGADPRASPAPPVVNTALPPPSPDRATITFVGTSVENAGTLSVYTLKPLAQQFERMYPSIKVNIREMETDPFLEAVAPTADCFSSGDLPDPVTITATYDLQPLIDTDLAFDLADFPAGLLQPYRHGSGLYGLPYSFNAPLLVYNKEAFDAVGASYPTADWQVDDFLRVAALLTDTSGDVPRYGFASTFPTRDLSFFLNLYGVTPFQGDGNARRPVFTDTKLIAALQSIIAIFRDFSPNQHLAGYVDYDQKPTDLINAGQVAMWLAVNFTFDTDDVAQRRPFTTSFVPVFSNESGGRLALFPKGGLYISSSTDQPQACWEFIKFLSRDLTNLQGDFPTRVSLAESQEFYLQAPASAPEIYQAYRPFLDTSTDDPYLHTIIANFWFLRAVDRALQGADLERELAEAQVLTEQYLFCVEAGGEREACAIQVDRGYNGIGYR